MIEDFAKRIVEHIHAFRNYHKEYVQDEFDIMIYNEIASSSYFETEYKILPICKKAYKDVHYKIDNVFYDVFLYVDANIDYGNLYQIILCDNYAEILSFPQNDYKQKKYVSRFSLITHRVHSFYDGSLIVIETNEGRAEVPYLELSCDGK